MSKENGFFYRTKGQTYISFQFIKDAEKKNGHT